MQLSVLLTRPYGCAAEERCISLQNRYRYFVSDYDLKQYVKTFFLRPAAFVFLEQSQDFFKGRSQWRNHGEGAKGLQPPSSKSLRKYNPKIQAFEHVLDLT